MHTLHTNNQVNAVRRASKSFKSFESFAPFRSHLKGLYGGLHFTLALLLLSARRSPAPPFPPDHRQAGERGAIIEHHWTRRLHATQVATRTQELSRNTWTLLVKRLPTATSLAVDPATLRLYRTHAVFSISGRVMARALIPYPHYPHGSRGLVRLDREGECPGTVAFISCLDSEIDDLGVIL